MRKSNPVFNGIPEFCGEEKNSVVLQFKDTDGYYAYVFDYVKNLDVIKPYLKRRAA
jgi:hypothetical protein